MAREVTTPIQQALDADDTESHDIMDIVLPPLVGQSLPEVLHLGTGAVVADYQGQPTQYHAKLRSMFQITYTRGASPDGGEFTITNLSNVYGPMFLNASRILDGATVVVRRAFRRATPPGGTPAAWHTDHIGEGMLRTRPIGRDEVRCAFVPDMSNSMVTIGGDPLTQRCLTVFNAGGQPVAPDDPRFACNWQLAQGGDPNNCDHVFDSPNGCLGHNNQHRCRCAPALTTTQAAPAGVTGPGGITRPDPDGGFGPGRIPSRDPDFDPDITRRPFLDILF